VIDPRSSAITVRKGVGATRVFRVGAPADAQIVAVRTGSPMLTSSEPVDDTKPMEAGFGLRAWLIAVSLSPEAPPGTAEATLQVLTSVEGVGTGEAELALNVQPDLRCIPERVFLGALRVGEKGEARLTVLHRDGKPFALSTGPMPVPGLAAQIGDEVGGRREVVVSLTPQQPGILRTELALITDVPQEERLVLPVYAEVQP